MCPAEFFALMIYFKKMIGHAYQKRIKWYRLLKFEEENL
jgi:hypothetical protein